MRRATGPGKVAIQHQAATPKRILSASLFNFDIDDATVKTEHQSWLSDNAIPLLLKDKSGKVFLRGTASKSGAADYNRALSKRRVEAVSAFLRTKGVQSPQISLNFTGEDFSVSKSNEDEGDRAVLLLLEAKTPTVRFQRLDPGNIYDGFDNSDPTRPPWLMVPVAGFKQVRLLGFEHVASVVSLNLGRARVQDLGSGLIQIQGLAAGRAFVEARDSNGLTLARLELGVKEKLVLQTVFHFVEDGAKPPHKTNRKPGKDVDDMIAAVNQIWLPQVNVEMKKLRERTAKYTQNFGNVIRFSSHLAGVPASQHEWHAVTAQADNNADLNVFFVWEYEQDTSPLIDNTEAAEQDRHILFEDNITTKPGVVLAHEGGHAQGLEHNNNSLNLMFSAPVNTSRKITRVQADIMNPSGLNP